jgi:hypothetical protein
MHLSSGLNSKPLFDACLHTHSSTLKMEAVHSFDTSMNFYQTIPCCIPEENTFKEHKV